MRVPEENSSSLAYSFLIILASVSMETAHPVLLFVENVFIFIKIDSNS